MGLSSNTYLYATLHRRRQPEFLSGLSALAMAIGALAIGGLALAIVIMQRGEDAAGGAVHGQGEECVRVGLVHVGSLGMGVWGRGGSGLGLRFRG